MSDTEIINIPQTDPRANYHSHKLAIDEAIRRTLESGRYILGREVEAFEAEFSAYIGVRYSCGVGNGTDALVLALQACGIGRGDLVFTVSHTAVATVAAVEQVGAQPVLVDINPTTYTMDPIRFAEAIKRYKDAGRVAAVLPVHLYGHPADMPAILEIARSYKMHVIEDCAQSHGASLNDKKTGAWGDIATFSFYPTKNLGALGDGGMVASNNLELVEKARLLRQYGWRQHYISDFPGSNSRLDELQAAILRVKLQYLDQENARRHTIAQMYNQHLADVDLILPISRKGIVHAYHQYVIRSSRRNELQVYLREHGIGTLIHYPQLVHQQPAYVGRLMGSIDLPNSELVATQVLSLPIYPELTDKQVTDVIKAIHGWRENA